MSCERKLRALQDCTRKHPRQHKVLSITAAMTRHSRSCLEIQHVIVHFSTALFWRWINNTQMQQEMGSKSIDRQWGMQDFTYFVLNRTSAGIYILQQESAYLQKFALKKVLKPGVDVHCLGELSSSPGSFRKCLKCVLSYQFECPCYAWIRAMHVDTFWLLECYPGVHVPNQGSLLNGLPM